MIDTWRSWPQLPYLNGWPRLGIDSVLMGTWVRCIGCGGDQGCTTVAFPENWQPPGPDPMWPFSEDACPVCWWREVWRRGGFSPEDSPVLDRLGHPKMVGPKGKLP